MTKDEIVNIVAKEVELLSGQRVQNYDVEIFKDGILDSLNVLNIIVFIESTFNIKINVFDVSLETFKSINSISDYVCTKL